MILNHEQLKKENLIEDAALKNYHTASYDLRIDKIIGVDGKQHKELKINPNSMVVAVSKETIRLPSNRIGHAFIKTRLSQRGIMANNIGIIDPQYSGQISTVLTNFGEKDFLIKENEIFLRVTISKIKKPEKDISLGFDPFTKESYLNMIKSRTMEYLGRYFINIDEVARSIENKVTENHKRETRRKNKLRNIQFVWTSLIIAALALLLNTAVIYYRDDKYDNLEKQLNKMQDSYHLDDLSKEKFRRDIQNLTEKNFYFDQKWDSIGLKNNKLEKK